MTGSVIGQTRTITGKVLDDQLRPFPKVRINSTDTVLLGETDLNGTFKIETPNSTFSLIINGIGLEWKLITLSPECSHLDIIMLNSGSYDFMSPRKVDRRRKKYFDTLPELHQSAQEKGIFKTAKPCYEDRFIPIKGRLEEIRRTRKQEPST